MYVAAEARGVICTRCDSSELTVYVVVRRSRRDAASSATTTRYISGDLGGPYLLGLADSCWREVA
jgi:hypothetical protein